MPRRTSVGNTDQVHISQVFNTFFVSSLLVVLSLLGLVYPLESSCVWRSAPALRSLVGRILDLAFVMLYCLSGVDAWCFLIWSTSFS